MNPIVIIGSGLAGYSLAREFRKSDQTTPLVIVTRDPGRLYSKPLLSNALVKFKDTAQLATFSKAQMEEQLNAEIIAETRVTEIIPEQKTIRLPGKNIVFEKLVFATGARAIEPPLKGDATNQILSVNSLVDYEIFREALIGKKHIAIIGSGLIGCEFANDLMSAGYQVDVASFEPWPIYRFLPESVGQLVKEQLAQQGIRWHMGHAVESVNASKNKFQLTLSNDESIEAELVLSAIGIVPDLSLVKNTSIKTNKGIVVDEYLETNIKDIYALGDSAQVKGLVLPFVMPLMHGARALAKTLAGEKTKVQYPCMPVVLKTPAYPVVVSPLVSEVDGDWKVEIDDEGAKALFFDKLQQLKAFALTGKKVAQRMQLAKEIKPWL